MDGKEELKRTPLYELYEKYQAKVVDFAGWELPVQFSSIMEEHETVRQAAGLFDVSHMGELLVTGKDAASYLNELLTNDVSTLQEGQAKYTAMCYPDGGTVDDFLVYKLADETYMLVVNAANTEKDLAWMKQHMKGDVKLENISGATALLALQGPKSESILQKLTDTDLSSIRPFRFKQDVELDGIQGVFVSRTGYTGEDGFELMVANTDAAALWEKLMHTGEEEGVLPCGLGARDTLRLEVRLPLYGQELSEQISPLEAGIGFAVKSNKANDFIGKSALAKQKEEGVKRKLAGIEMTGRGIPRPGYKVFSANGEEVGFITSGTYSPSLKKNIGLALLSHTHQETGTPLKVEVRKKMIDAIVVKTPFYQKQ